MNKIMHYFRDPIPEIKLDWNYCRDRSNNYKWTKPDGLWISIEDGWSWLDWNVNGSGTFCHRLQYKYEIQIDPKANILRLQTPEEIRNFSKKYNFYPTGNDYDLYETEDIYAINWLQVKEKYQGIIIAPYQNDCRLELDTAWYYGWDCSSGCIWDLSVITDFKLVCSEPVFSKYE